MLEYRKEQRSQKTTPDTVHVPTTAGRRSVNVHSSSDAARAQKSGLARLKKLAKELSGPDLDATTNSPSTDELSEQEKAEAERRAAAEDERIVDAELKLYEAEGIVEESSPEFEDFDLLRYWDVSCIPQT